MNTKIQTVIQIAEAIEYTKLTCPVSAYAPMFNDRSCQLTSSCRDCIFNGLNQPDTDRLEILIGDIKNGQ